jgi:hypothetical protein
MTDTILGSFGNDRRLFAARLTRTDQTRLEVGDTSVTLDVPAMQKARTLSLQPLMLQAKARQAQDAEEKAKLLKEAQAAGKEVQAAMPKLYQQVLAKHADSPVVFEAALNLVRNAARSKSDAKQVSAWAGAAAKAAERHGRRWQSEINKQLAAALVNQEKYSTQAVEYAHKAAGLLRDDTAPAQQAELLTILVGALKKAGKPFDAEEKRLSKLEADLDREYLTKVQPFKPESFDGRKEKSDRAVVMELFTGAQCPPCVAADVAFDVLQKTYKPTDVVLIQYHLHIPGPDPLTNADAEARFDYYRKVFPDQMRGTPSTVFNGQPGAGGGGGLANARGKYDQYRKIITPLLETAAAARLTANVDRKGDELRFNLEVRDLANPGESKKLRLVLVEETVRYTGTNGLRLHHQVVRALPGGAAGTALPSKDSKHTFNVNLNELRERLNTYLDDYAANQRPFPHVQRPLDLKNLKLIAFVQDDENQEIVQAVQVDVP